MAAIAIFMCNPITLNASKISSCNATRIGSYSRAPLYGNEVI